MPRLHALSLRQSGRIFLLGLLLALSSPTLYALPFATGKAGGGFTYLTPDKGGKSSATAILSGTGRFGYLFDESPYFFAIDANAFRVYKSSQVKANIDGNTALAVFGYQWEIMSFWIAAGAGEVRSYDREDDKGRPYRYYTNEQAMGYQIQLYAADYARVELGASLNRMTPDADFRAKTGMNSVNSLQIDIGFKLFNW